MFDEDHGSFSGFMPMIGQVHITKETSMINTEGELVTAHTVSIKTRDGLDHVFSISNYDLMRLFFLINKVIQSD